MRVVFGFSGGIQCGSRDDFWGRHAMGGITCERMVAPSFVTVMSPSGEMRILSKPRGPCFSISVRALFFPLLFHREPYQRCSDNVRYRPRGQNVRLDRLITVLPLLFPLTVALISSSSSLFLLLNLPTYSLTIMKGRPDSSLVTWASRCQLSFTLAFQRTETPSALPFDISSSANTR